MPEATFHDGSTIEIEVHGAGPTLLLPVNPQPVTGPLAEQMRKSGTDPALGQSLIKGLSDAFRVVAFDYEGQCLRRPKPETLTPANTANDLLAVADAVSRGIRMVWHLSLNGSDPAICHPVPGLAGVR